jgi:uroporphyrinogen-III synthase
MRELVGRARLAAQGNGTALACEEYFQRPPDFIPSVFVAEEFAKEFGDVVSASEAVIVPQSAEGRDVLAPSLVARGIAAESFSLYGLEAVTPPTELIARLAELPHGSTAVVFMSPSAVRAAMNAAGDAIRTKRIVSVGPITSKEIRAHGLSVWAEAREHSEDGVLEVLANIVLP